jgi:hypothetical protein
LKEECTLRVTDGTIHVDDIPDPEEVYDSEIEDDEQEEQKKRCVDENA